MKRLLSAVFSTVVLSVAAPFVAIAQSDTLSVTPVAAAPSAPRAASASKTATNVTPVKPTFGYLSYDSVLHAMPDYAVAVAQMDRLKAKYAAEAERVEKEFNTKYEEFLEGQRDFPQTILLKRQTELQELLDKNILFKEESKRLLKAAEKDIFAPLHARLSAELRAIGTARGYSFIINTDNNACPFVNPSQGEDIGRLVLERMK